MSKPRYGWWGYAKDMIRRYPDQCNDNERSAVHAAIEQTERMCSGVNRLKVVDMVFWKRTHTLEGAALQIPCSYDTAQRYHADFIKTVAQNFRCDGLSGKMP